MKSQISLSFNISKPCNQDWNTMTASNQGRYCSECNKVVYDFSQMDDTELLDFFKQRSTRFCGRFHNSQLHREILPQNSRRHYFFSRFNKIAAAFLTVLSFKSISSKAEIKHPNFLTVLDSNYKGKVQTDSGKIVITGIIIDMEGMPLGNAKVLFDSDQVAVTGKDGKFSFDLKEVSLLNHNLYFAYDSMVTVVRNYHPAMLSTNYEVELYKPGVNKSFYTMGDPMAPVLDLPSLIFKVNSVKLTSESKSLLAEVAYKLKSNPSINIKLNGYYHDSNQKAIYAQRIEVIKKYLVEREGLAAERITTDSEKDGGNLNVVDLLQRND